jgi:hypothetical protein
MAGTTRKLLVRFAAERGLDSARAIARELAITPQSVSLLLHGKRVMSAETAMTVCALLGLDVEDTLRALLAERAAKQKRGTRPNPPGGGSTGKILPTHAGQRPRMHQPRLF